MFDHSAEPPCNCDGLEYFLITRAPLVTAFLLPKAPHKSREMSIDFGKIIKNVF